MINKREQQSTSITGGVAFVNLRPLTKVSIGIKVSYRTVKGLVCLSLPPLLLGTSICAVVIYFYEL